MGKANYFQQTLLFFIIITFVLIFIFNLETPSKDKSIPTPRGPPPVCPSVISDQAITPLLNTKHFLVSAFMDQRVKGFDIRIIGMFHRDSIQKLHCLFCCVGHLGETTPTTVLVHSDHFGFPFATTDVMCQIPQNCTATHVTLLTQPSAENISNLTWIPIRNRKNIKDEEKMNFTVCISSLFGGYNNVLQFAQTLEMYRLLGINRVVVYNTSCGPDLDRLLQSYAQEGFVEIVLWPIEKHMNPSKGWLFSQHGGDIHYYGQNTKLNECLYRAMENSRYVLLHDIDQIVMPYQHNDLMSLMDTLQQQHPNVGVFRIESHSFSKMRFEPSGRFHLPQWSRVPGVNILEHTWREEPNWEEYHPYKMVIQPRMVEQTSVHEVIKHFGQEYKVPPQVCRIIHICSGGTIPLELLHEDKRLWAFHEKLIPNVDRVLKRVEMLSSKN
ncbi:uncharacterized protein LOC106518486 [Austrofundulus limnaeus]|uniref:Glycosyltransferase family 92 protein n=1 Tax=Austrofundulus limnaeus TaxID=52670 RepID=A0A2I4BC19_AUSLI|nr:PREDICTED: uncharacterized protein LOC106518486 [Austrofundulus limnaeus]XP_013865253.1 PREDICTED: uncharacterized protein LOC106518486 [Austrofundulus limnaeus]